MKPITRLILWLISAGIALLLIHLAQGQTFQRSLPFLAKSEAVGSQFTPLNVSNMIFWFSTDKYLTNDSGVSPPADGDKIVMWGDQSGNGNHITNLLDKICRYYANRKNGYGTFLSTETHAALIKYSVAWPQPLTFFMVATNCAMANGDSKVLVDGTNTAVGSVNAMLYGVVGDVKVRVNPGTLMPYTGALNTNTWYIYTFQFDGANTLARTNGWQDAAVTGASGTRKYNGIKVGSLSSGLVLAPEICEYIGYDAAVTSNDMFLVEKYLSKKYQITNNVLDGL